MMDACKILDIGPIFSLLMVYKFDEQGEKTPEQKMVVSLAIHTDTSSVQNVEFTLNMNFNGGQVEQSVRAYFRTQFVTFDYILKHGY